MFEIIGGKGSTGERSVFLKNSSDTVNFETLDIGKIEKIIIRGENTETVKTIILKEYQPLTENQSQLSSARQTIRLVPKKTENSTDNYVNFFPENEELSEYKISFRLSTERTRLSEFDSLGKVLNKTPF